MLCGLVLRMIRLGPHWHKVHMYINLVLLMLVVVLQIGGYKAHYCYNTITHSATKLYSTINNILAQLIAWIYNVP